MLMRPHEPQTLPGTYVACCELYSFFVDLHDVNFLAESQKETRGFDKGEAYFVRVFGAFDDRISTTVYFLSENLGFFTEDGVACAQHYWGHGTGLVATLKVS